MILKAAYGKDFIYYDDKGWGINGSIDIKSWRARSPKFNAISPFLN